MLDLDGLFKVGRRFSKAPLLTQAKYLIIRVISTEARVTVASRWHHAGPSLMVSMLTSTFHITGATKKGITCHK